MSPVFTDPAGSMLCRRWGFIKPLYNFFGILILPAIPDRYHFFFVPGDPGEYLSHLPRRSRKDITF